MLTQDVVTKTQMPDIFPLFQAAARGARENDLTGRDIEREINYATLEAIDDAAVKVPPMDVNNALLRLGIARYLLDAAYNDGMCGTEQEFNSTLGKIEKLIDGAATVFAREHGVDIAETVLDFYLINLRTAK